MRVCIAVSTIEGWDSPIHGHFGSAPGFAIVDLSEDDSLSFMANLDMGHGHGACNPAKTLEASRVDAVVVGGIGQRALERLSAAGVAVYRSEARTVREAAKAIRNRTATVIGPLEACQGHHEAESHCH